MSNSVSFRSEDGADEPIEMSLPGYQRLIGTLVGVGYEPVDFEMARPDSRHLILRHDVDMCLDRAAILAELETAMRVRAHYFILLDTEMYNVGSHRSRAALKRITDGGHEIGLHFDASRIPDGNVDALQSEVCRECRILEDHLGQPVKVVTFHRPANWALGLPEPLAGRLHAYQPRFFTEMGYCSDSQGRFRFHQPLAHPAVQAGRALQLVTHPIWWVAQSTRGPIAKLRTFLGHRRRLISDELAANCQPFAEWRRKDETAQTQ